MRIRACSMLACVRLTARQHNYALSSTPVMGSRLVALEQLAQLFQILATNDREQVPSDFAALVVSALAFAAVWVHAHFGGPILICQVVNGASVIHERAKHVTQRRLGERPPAERRRRVRVHVIAAFLSRFTQRAVASRAPRCPVIIARHVADALHVVRTERATMARYGNAPVERRLLFAAVAAQRLRHESRGILQSKRLDESVQFFVIVSHGSLLLKQNVIFARHCPSLLLSRRLAAIR